MCQHACESWVIFGGPCSRNAIACASPDSYEPTALHNLSSDGGNAGIGVARRTSMALRAEVGWLSVPRVPRRRKCQSRIEIAKAADALFPGVGRGVVATSGAKIRPGR